MSFIVSGADRVLGWTGAKDLYSAGASAYEGEFSKAGKQASVGLLKAAVTATAIYTTYMAYSYMTAEDMEEPLRDLQSIKWDQCPLGGSANSTVVDLPQSLPTDWPAERVSRYCETHNISLDPKLFPDYVSSSFSNSTIEALPQSFASDWTGSDSLVVPEVTGTVNSLDMLPELTCAPEAVLEESQQPAITAGTTLVDQCRVASDKFMDLIGTAEAKLPQTLATDWPADRVVSLCDTNEMCPDLSSLRGSDYTDPMNFPLSGRVQDALDLQYAEDFTDMSPDPADYYQHQLDHGYFRGMPESKFTEFYGEPDASETSKVTRDLYHAITHPVADMAHDCESRGICTDKETTARLVYDTRHVARIYARDKGPKWAKDWAENRDLGQYENRHGPTFEYLRDRKKGDYDAIINSASKTNWYVDKYVDFWDWMGM